MTSYVISSGATSSYRLGAKDVLTVLSGGTSIDTVVRGVEVASAGGIVGGGRVLSGGVDLLERGARESGVVLSSGAVLELGGLRVSSGQTLSVGGLSPGAVVSGVDVASGGVVDALGAVVLGGGFLYIGSGGASSSSTVSSGGYEVVSSGASVAGANVKAGGALIVSGGLGGVINDAGIVESGTVVSGGVVHVGYDGLAAYMQVASGGVVSVSAYGDFSDGGVASGATLEVAAGGYAFDPTISGGALVDDGNVYFYNSGTSVLAGSLSGSGHLAQAQPGTLKVQADLANYGGSVELYLGTLEVDATTGLGSATIIFAGTQTNTTLRLETADQPANGSTYATPLEYFISSAERLDLAGVPFVSGATATVSGSTLTLKDGGYTAAFKLAEEGASAYVVVSDGSAGGTLIRAKAGASVHSLIEAVAGFDIQQNVTRSDEPSWSGGVASALALAHAFNAKTSSRL